MSAAGRSREQGGSLSPQQGATHLRHYLKLLEEGTVPVGTCPDCEAEVHVDLDADKGDTVTCDECSTELEIVGLDPVELDIAEEDLDDDLSDDADEDEY